MSEGKPTVRQRRLGFELRQLRHGCGWTLDQAAQRLEMRLAALSKIETGRQRVRTRELPAFFEVYGLTDAVRRKSITNLAREALKKNWWQGYEEVVSDHYADYLSLEVGATDISIFDPQVIPGLLQTEAYASALTEASRVTRTQAEAAQFVKLRMERQQLLERPDAPRLWVVLTELSLRQEVGGREALREQLTHVVALVEALPHVAVQVLPYCAGAHAGSDGGFALMRFPTGGDVICVESMRASLYLEEPADVSLYVETLNHLKSSAISVRDSLSMITGIAKELEL